MEKPMPMRLNKYPGGLDSCFDGVEGLAIRSDILGGLAIRSGILDGLGICFG